MRMWRMLGLWAAAAELPSSVAAAAIWRSSVIGSVVFLLKDQMRRRRCTTKRRCSLLAALGGPWTLTRCGGAAPLAPAPGARRGRHMRRDSGLRRPRGSPGVLQSPRVPGAARDTHARAASPAPLLGGERASSSQRR